MWIHMMKNMITSCHYQSKTVFWHNRNIFAPSSGADHLKSQLYFSHDWESREQINPCTLSDSDNFTLTYLSTTVTLANCRHL